METGRECWEGKGSVGAHRDRGRPAVGFLRFMGDTSFGGSIGPASRLGTAPGKRSSYSRAISSDPDGAGGTAG
jgi:hypothetical protein